MPSCAAFGCSYQTGFPIGKPDLLAKWLANLARKDYQVTKNSRLCSDHFLDTCFKEDLYAKYVGVTEGTKRRRLLKEDAVPTEFSHRTTAKPREAIVVRIQKRERATLIQEVASTPKRRRVAESTIPASETTGMTGSTPVHTQQTPLKPVYGTPRRRDHSYYASLFQQSSTQTDPELSLPSTSTQDVPSTSAEAELSSEPFSELSEPAELLSESPEHQPTSSSSTDSAPDEDEPVKFGACEMPKYIVFEENLDELHKFCNKCGSPVIKLNKFTKGTMVGYRIKCHDGHSYVWHSQPTERQQPVGNLLISAALLGTGGSYRKMSAFADALNLQFFSETAYYRIQKEHLLPVIQEVWEEEKNKAVEEVKALGSVVLAGDARCDSPGHTAKYGSYTLMHVDGEGIPSTRKIVSMNLVQVSEVKNSNHMEPEGLERCLKEVKDGGLQVATLATDRHLMISSMMRKKYAEIEHQFDIWHVGKSITKQLNAKAKTKICDELGPWIQSLSNHLWWACSTCGGDEQVLREKWLSVLHHVVNKHKWSANQKFHKCAHQALSAADRKSTKWLKPNSAAFAALKAVVSNTRILKALAHLTKFCHTGELEVFHNMLLKYCPKRQHFHYDAMYSRLMLAAIEWNNTVREEQSAKSVVYSKRRKAFVLRTRYKYEKSPHTERLMNRVYTVHKDKISLPPFKRPDLPKVVSGGVVKPTKAELEAKFKTRFRR